MSAFLATLIGFTKLVVMAFFQNNFKIIKIHSVALNKLLNQY